MIDNPYQIARDAIMETCRFTMEDVKTPRGMDNPFKPGKILKKINDDLAKQINIFKKEKKPTKDQVMEGCVSDHFQHVFLAKDEDEILEFRDACELTKYKTIENLFDLSERFEPKTLDAFAVFSGYLGWNDMDFNERFSYKEIRESEKQNMVNNSLSKQVDEMHLDIGEINKIVKSIHENKVNRIPQELTVYLPRLRADQVVGRSTDIEDIQKRLFDNKQVVLINGMGGIGKTTVGAVYVTENLRVYKHIAWISQLSGDFVNDFISTPGLLETFNITKEDKTIDQLFNETIMALKNVKDTPCLLVIDNADTELAKYYNSLPNQPNWHILVTSREKIPYFDLKVLGFLDEEDAVKLFKKSYKRTDITNGNIKNIVKEIDYHTLTIEMLAKTAYHNRMSPKSILKAIGDDLKADITIRHSSEKIEKVTSYLCSIFKLSNLSKNEKWLLANLSCFPPEFHAYRMLKKIIQTEKTKGLDFAKIISNLTSKGWLLYDKTNDSYKLHRILIEVISKSVIIKIETVQPLLSFISSILSIDQNKDNPKDKFKWIPYGKAVLRQFNTNTSPSLSVLQNNLALVLKEFGGKENLLEAKKLLEKAINSAKNNFGLDNPTTVGRYSNLAVVLQGLGDYEGAKKLLVKVIVSDENNFGLDHPTTIVSYSNLAVVLGDLGDYEAAKKLFEKAKVSAEKIFGLDHPTTVGIYSNLALELKALGDYEGAKKLLEKATLSAERIFGLDHPTTSDRYSSLALVLKDLGDLKGASKLLEKAMVSDEKNFGKFHSKTAVSYSNLATVLIALGDYDGAKKLLEKATVSGEKNFGKLHPNTAVSYSNLAVVLKDLGDYVGSKKNFEKARLSAEKSFGSDHPTTVGIYSNLALVLQNLGDYDGAKKLLDKAMVSDEKNFGLDHPTMVVRYSNLALVLNDLGDYVGSKKLFEKAKLSAEKYFGLDHPDTAVIYSNMALTLLPLGNYDGAMELLEKAKVSNEKNLGTDHPTTVANYSILASVLKDIGDYNRAKKLLMKVKVSTEKIFGLDHPTTAIRYSNLATVLIDLGDYKGAKELLEKAKDIVIRILGIDHPTTITIINNLESLRKL